MPDLLAGWPLAWPVPAPTRSADPRPVLRMLERDPRPGLEPDLDEPPVDADRVGIVDKEQDA